MLSTYVRKRTKYIGRCMPLTGKPEGFLYFLSLIFCIVWTISNYDCGEQNSCTFAPVPPTTMDQLQYAVRVIKMQVCDGVQYLHNNGRFS